MYTHVRYCAYAAASVQRRSMRTLCPLPLRFSLFHSHNHHDNSFQAHRDTGTLGNFLFLFLYLFVPSYVGPLDSPLVIVIIMMVVGSSHITRHSSVVT
ncbi:hypothetical protein HDK90DRAFT_356743 [Phyllosticta capitalensis]|uniref:Uncharacterized protein n=1 Tax=Phyllosticta capitalensis TaxID=121624 RepID=A0ABR1YHC2_9PEZI